MEISFSIQWVFLLLVMVVWHLILPGAILVSIFNFGRNPLKNIALFMPVGVIFFSIISFGGYLSEAPIQHIGTTILISNFIGILFLTTKTKEIIRRFKKIRIAKESESIKDLALIGLITTGLFVISLFSEWHPRGDAAIHLQCIHNLIGADRLVMPFYSLVGHPIIPDHTYDAYYVLLALFQKHTEMPLDIMWHYLSPVFILFVPAVFYYLSRVLSTDRKLVRVFLILFFICTTLFPGLLNATLADAMVYPNRFYFFILLPLMLGQAIDYLKSGNIKNLILSALCINTFFFIHQSGYLFTLVLLGGAFILNFFSKNWRNLFKRYIILLAILIVSSAPLLFLKLSSNLSFIQKASDDIWKSHSRFSMFTDTFYAFPIGRYGNWGMVIALAIMLFLFFKQRKGGTEVILMNSLLTSSILFPMLIVFNPLVVPALGKLISYPAIGRMLRIPLYYFIFGYGIYWSLSHIPLISRFSILFNRVSFSLNVCLVIAITTFQTYGQQLVHKIPPIAEIAFKIPEGSTVYANKLTCTDIAEFKRVTVPLIQFNGTIDLVPIDQEKKEALHFFSEKTDIRYIQAIVQKYGVNYIVLQKSAQSEKCESFLNELFSLTYQNEAYSLYTTVQKQNIISITQPR